MRDEFEASVKIFLYALSEPQILTTDSHNKVP